MRFDVNITQTNYMTVQGIQAKDKKTAIKIASVVIDKYIKTPAISFKSKMRFNPKVIKKQLIGGKRKWNQEIQQKY